MFRIFGLAAAFAVMSSPALAITCGTWHVIQKGETLSSLARDVLGSRFAYATIHQANRAVIGPDPALVEVGTRIYLPCQTDAGTPPATADAAGWDVMVDADVLAQLVALDATQVLDIRPPADVAGGVISGAVAVPYDDFRGPAQYPGRPPEAEALARVIGASGLRLDQPIVIVHSLSDAVDTARGAYVYWLLKSAGARQLALLDGGYAAWAAAGHAVAPTPAVLPPYSAEPSMAPDWRATRKEVEQVAGGQARGALIDACPASDFRQSRQPRDLLPSEHIVSAHATFAAHSGSENGGITVLDRLKAAPVNWEEDPVINFCNTGELGALNWFFASELSGIGNVRLFPESTAGWLRSGEELAMVDDTRP